MAPDRGADISLGNPDYHSISNPLSTTHEGNAIDAQTAEQLQNNDVRRFEASRTSEGRNFTLRGILVGLGVGLILCFSNMYFGLQTGWVSMMSMPSSLIGFAFFKTLSKHLDLPFTPVENVLVQTVAGAMGTMPLGCGYVGVMPALNYMLKPEENGPVFLSLWKLVLWGLGLCFFGVVFAVPLRKQVIIREKLKFPSGTATALMIGVLHGKQILNNGPVVLQESQNVLTPGRTQSPSYVDNGERDVETLRSSQQKSNWKSNIKLLAISFTISGLYTLATYFFPILRSLPVFGFTLAESWLWTLNPSLAYVGQGIIMGPEITAHMLLGAIAGWAVLSPLAKGRGWAPGPVDDWETGSKGWIVWISLAIMLADSIVSLGYISVFPLLSHAKSYTAEFRRFVGKRGWKGLFQIGTGIPYNGYTRIAGSERAPRHLAETGPFSQESSTPTADIFPQSEVIPEPDAPREHLVSGRTVWAGLIISIIFCIATIRIIFGELVPLYATIAAVLMALVLSIMGVRALGETDLNPVSGISKLAQLFFAIIIPQSNKNSVLINLIAGAISEAGAFQAGDLMQDLKTGHLLGAAPNAQFWGQIIGSAVGAIVSALIYRLYTSVYEVPGDLFQVPTGYVWIFTARLVTGKGLPHMVWQWAVGAAAIFSVTTVLRTMGSGKRWHPYVPSGIAVAVGMYNVPSFTLARAIGGLVYWYWRSYRRHDETTIVILASGLILGEGVVSIVNLFLASASVSHL